MDFSAPFEHAVYQLLSTLSHGAAVLYGGAVLFVVALCLYFVGAEWL